MAEKSKILLVDDDQEVLELYSEILADAGYEVDKVLNGQEALSACEAKRYDLILLDLMMPVMDGIETLKRLRADEAKYGHPVIVALTNVTMAVNVREAFEYGADGYLVKLSVSDDLLVEKVKGYLKGFKQQPPTGEAAAVPAAAVNTSTQPGSAESKAPSAPVLPKPETTPPASVE
jgi:two-component system response regulator CpxR